MVLLFSILVFGIFTALGTAPVSMLIWKVMAKEKLRFEQAFVMCFYAGISVWLVYSMFAVYFGDEGVVAGMIAGFVVGYFVYVIMLQRMYAYSGSRSVVMSGVLIIATFVVLIVEFLALSGLMMLYNSILP